MIYKKFRLSLKKKDAKPVVLLENLPGLPDNIRPTNRGTFLVGLAGHRSEGIFSAFDKLGPLPLVRKILLTVSFIKKNVL